MKLDKDTKGIMIATGGTLIALAITPTPDDITIISPVLQLVAGVALIVVAGIS